MYVSANGGRSAVLLSANNAKLGYDATKRRLFIYEPGQGKLSTMLLDGSDKQLAFSSGTINRFTIDDIQEKIYFLAKTTEFTKSVNFDGTGTTTLLGDGYSDLSDIQVDSINRYVQYSKVINVCTWRSSIYGVQFIQMMFGFFEHEINGRETDICEIHILRKSLWDPGGEEIRNQPIASETL